MVARTTHNYYDDPVLTTIESFTYPVDKVQFPTITVCPPRKMDLWKLNMVLEKLCEYLYYSSDSRQQ